MTSEQAVNAGLVNELMTVVTDEEITPPKFSGTYKLERKFGSPGYQLIFHTLNQSAELLITLKKCKSSAKK